MDLAIWRPDTRALAQHRQRGGAPVGSIVGRYFCMCGWVSGPDPGALDELHAHLKAEGCRDGHGRLQVPSYESVITTALVVHLARWLRAADASRWSRFLWLLERCRPDEALVLRAVLADEAH